MKKTSEKFQRKTDIEEVYGTMYRLIYKNEYIVIF